jgi:hypothetical protein
MQKKKVEQQSGNGAGTGFEEMRRQRREKKELSKISVCTLKKKPATGRSTMRLRHKERWKKLIPITVTNVHEPAAPHNF